ncbi:Vms1/Ankzf1 family peptidyl-tRNA hydrolase [Actinoplanes sp. URMC 104]|uniref:baeRF2 domain-containing protein n=1 Tax=Actinoplanes sp. URMC 104 TaxID=3423409 RepID=UPI003F195380
MDLSFLRPLFSRPGPWASIYLDASRDDENAQHQIELRFRALAEQLTEAGADEATVAAMREAVLTQAYGTGRYGLAVFATEGSVELVEPLSAPPPADTALWGPLPHAMPLVASRGEEVPYVRVQADHTGGEVVAVSADGVPRTRHVKGSQSFPLRKVNAGGWRHLRYLHAVDDAWKRNAGDVAAAATDLADRVGAEVILVTGDPRSRPYVVEALPKRWADRIVTADLTGDSDALDDVTVQAIADAADRQTRAVIDRFEAQAGSGGGSTGLADVVTHLTRGQVDTVLLVDDPSSTDRLWIGPDDPTLISADAELLRSSGIDPVEVRADAALVRAIAGTDAALVLVAPEEVKLTDGIGAVLRYQDAG